MIYSLLFLLLLFVSIVCGIGTYKADKRIFKPNGIEEIRNTLLKYDGIAIGIEEYIDVLKKTTQQTIVEFNDITQDLIQSLFLIDIDYDEDEQKARVKESYAVVRLDGKIVPYTTAQGKTASLIFDYRSCGLNWRDILL